MPIAQVAALVKHSGSNPALHRSRQPDHLAAGPLLSPGDGGYFDEITETDGRNIGNVSSRVAG